MACLVSAAPCVTYDGAILPTEWLHRSTNHVSTMWEEINIFLKSGIKIAITFHGSTKICQHKSSFHAPLTCTKPHYSGILLGVNSWSERYVEPTSFIVD